MSDTASYDQPMQAAPSPVIDPSTGAAPQAQSPQADPNVPMFKTASDVKKRYFRPSEIAAEAVAYINGVNAIPGIAGTAERNYADSMIRTNYPADYEFGNDGYGIAVIPVGKQSDDDSGNVVSVIVIAAVPDPELILADDSGQAYVRDVLVNSFCTRLGNAARGKKDGNFAPMPFTVQDFITASRGKESLKTFSELAPEMVKALKEKGVKFMTVQILKNCLQSHAFAESQFGDKISQENWEFVISVLIERAGDKGLDPAILNSWLQNRNQRALELDIDLDFSDLADLA